MDELVAMQNDSNNLHNTLRCIIETDNVHVFLQLTHFLVDLNIDVDVRILRILSQECFDSKL